MQWLHAYGDLILGWVAAYWPALPVGVALWILYRLAATFLGPTDSSSNGIVIGRAKAFDNRSLTLILEQLNASLQTFNVLSQDVAQNLGAFQEQRSTVAKRSLKAAASFALGNAPLEESGETAPTAKAEKNKDADATDNKTAATPAKEDSKADFNPRLGVAAGDALTDQLNLAYQILNLRMINERSLSDRLHGESPRLQAVLGFQISIDPPNHMKNCVAVAEVGLTVSGSSDPISIVAMIPQEKTYNAATLSSQGDSLDGSVVSRVLNIGAAMSRQQKNLFLHRDADTVAFERNPDWNAGAFGLVRQQGTNSRTIFGWGFRPVLGRRSVSPGVRQMLAVVALPRTDAFADANTDPGATLEIRTRTYWRRYYRKRQTTGVRLSWWPFACNGSWEIASDRYDLPVPPTMQVETRLEPRITKLDWIDAGAGAAVVLAEGENLFSGTEVTMGGTTYRSGDGRLVLKSDHAFELHTTIDALAKGDAVLSGRYGRSAPMRAASVPPAPAPPAPAPLEPAPPAAAAAPGAEVPAPIPPAAARPAAVLPARGIDIVSASRSIVLGQQYSRLKLSIVALPYGQPLRTADFDRLPAAIIYLKDIHIPFPYDYNDATIEILPNLQAQAVIVQAWVPASMTSGVVTFKVPFCGPDWSAGSMISIDAPSIKCLGGDTHQTLIITGATDFADGRWTATLDKDYTLGASAEFSRLTKRQLSLKLPRTILCKYDKLELRLVETGYLLDIPPLRETVLDAVLDEAQTPPTVSKGKSAIIDLKGSMLSNVTKATLGTVELPFQAYADGGLLRLFLNSNLTAREGQLEIKLTRSDESTLFVHAYVLDQSTKPEEGSPATPV